MRHAVIMAGGAGQRLWPLSRTLSPKQLLPLVNGKSLLELAVERLDGLFDKEHIFIITSARYVEQVAAALPQIPPGNIIPEPQGRDTANAIALAVQMLAGRDEEATMAVFTADHVIRPADRFARTIRVACDAAERNPSALLTFGVHPTWPHTGLGYIHCGKKIDDGVYEVQAFKEKPDHQTARRYIDSGQYYWNSGMFIWKLGAIRRQLTKHLPDSMAKLSAVAEAVRAGRDISGLLKDVYATLERISIDFAVMEKADKVLMVELDCDWLDVGSWLAMERINEHDGAGNIVTAPNAVLLDSLRNIIVSDGDHLVAVLGMDDCIVIHSADATLVCDKADSQRLKELVTLIREKFGQKYL